MQEIIGALRTGAQSDYTDLTTVEALTANLKVNCIPANFAGMDCSDYDRFLEARRKLMAAKIHQWFDSIKYLISLMRSHQSHYQ